MDGRGPLDLLQHAERRGHGPVRVLVPGEQQEDGVAAEGERVTSVPGGGPQHPREERVDGVGEPLGALVPSSASRSDMAVKPERSAMTMVPSTSSDQGTRRSGRSTSAARSEAGR